MTIGERLKKIRVNKGLTQRGLGKLILKPHTSISKIERGIQGISFAEVLEICTALGITILDLVDVPTEALTREIRRRQR